MNPYIREVIDVHVAIENWLGKGEGDVEALLARFAPSFSMVTTGGAKLDFAMLSAFFRGQGAAKPGLKIVVEEITIVEDWLTGAVVSYSERQSLPGQEATLRYSTVVFADGKWKLLHETMAV
ncbi:DUF4440 domain-containing protein [Buttiauxella sp.]|uniref:DUF4440 domain-containing protein n=1 Tax=Buttiauxella sp. TaxID=1972222 RepID=UPI003C78A8A2